MVEAMKLVLTTPLHVEVQTAFQPCCSQRLRRVPLPGCAASARYWRDEGHSDHLRAAATPGALASGLGPAACGWSCGRSAGLGGVQARAGPALTLPSLRLTASVASATGVVHPRPALALINLGALQQLTGDYPAAAAHLQIFTP